jgi:inorganic triphosphatase YgiF
VDATRDTAGSSGNAGTAPIETEITLVVIADPPEPVADAVAALTELDGFALIHAPDQAIRDRYFGTRDRRLAGGGSLRLRELDARRLLTIKGAPQPGSHIGVKRTEHEEPWPDRAWALLRAELGETLAVPAALPASDPVRALESLGLAVVQDRTTARRVRAILPRSGGRARVAELAIDAVTFDLDGHAVRHHELELEVKGDGGDDAIETLAASLHARFEGLRPWHLGKLATGGAIARLIAAHGPDAVLTPDGHVRPGAYEAIEAGV